MRRLVFAVLTILLLSGTALALKDWWVYDTNIDSYTGQIARDRRIYDPYTRERYFGADYQKQFVNFGMKGPTDRFMKTGAKSAFSSVFNLDTNTLSNYGRTPGHISNFDPNVRGYPRMDIAVDLLPFGPLAETIDPKEVLNKGTARIYTTGDAWGAGLNRRSPRTQFFLTAINMPPLGEDEMYEAWLFDTDTEYPLSLGLLKAGAGITMQLFYEIRRKVEMFDVVMITREPFPDLDPNPSEIVLWGNIGQTRDILNPDAALFERIR